MNVGEANMTQSQCSKVWYFFYFLYFLFQIWLPQSIVLYTAKLAWLALYTLYTNLHDGVAHIGFFLYHIFKITIYQLLCRILQAILSKYESYRIFHPQLITLRNIWDPSWYYEAPFLWSRQRIDYPADLTPAAIRSYQRHPDMRCNGPTRFTALSEMTT